MSLWRHLGRGLRVLLRRGDADRELDEELAHYAELAEAAHRARGLSPQQARRAARLEVGGAVAVREQVRDAGWEHVASSALADLRYAARRLRAIPGFTVVAVLTLALGIGASTAIFSAVNPVLFQPLPYPHPNRIVLIADVGSGGSPLDPTFGTYRELAVRSRSFRALAAYKPWQPTLSGTDRPERLGGQRVSDAYFDALGVTPALGRGFLPSEDVANGPDVAIISDGLWRRRFGADPAIVGRRVRLNGAAFTVVGVMPRGFENVTAPGARIWAPLQYDASLPPDGREWGHHLHMIGRLRAGVTAVSAEQELMRIARTPVPEFARPSWASLPHGLRLTALRDEITRGVKPALLAVLGAVLLLLAIASVNVTNLLLARGAQRRGELAMRTALGASRARLVRQLVTESVLLAVIGGAVGLLVAQVGVRALVALSPAALPRVDAIAVNGAAFAFALGVSALVGIVVGLAPALRVTRGDPRADLEGAARRTAGGHRGARRTLVVAEVALALVLLVGAGLLLRSLRRLFAVPPGFEPANVLVMKVQTAGGRYDDDAAVHRFYDDALAAVRHVPGVEQAAFSSELPLSGEVDLTVNMYGVQLESAPDAEPRLDHAALRYAVTPGYLAAMRVPIRRGRALSAHDDGRSPWAAVISASLARRRFPGLDPIGQRIHVGSTSAPWYTVVGVAGDVKQASLAATSPDAVYIPIEQTPFADRAMWLVVRSHRAAAALAPALESAIWSVDRDQAVTRVGTMAALVAASAAERRFALIVFAAFALAALALAATGIYGVLAGGVAERMREIGVRSALGASRSDLVGLVVGEGMALAGLGVVIGLAGAAIATRALVTLLFGVSRLDPLTYAGVLALLLGVAAAACGVPAWRAARVDPTITLRAE